MGAKDGEVKNNMQSNEMAKETAKALKMLDDIREIDDVLTQEQNGYGFDRQKAQDIIRKHNVTDPNVYFVNNCTPNAIPLVCASDDTLRNNLMMIRKYICANRGKELVQKLLPTDI